MKFKYLFLLAASVWLVGVTTSMAAPLRAANRLTTAIRFTPETEVAPDLYRTCQTKSPAVVTVYAANETGSGSIISPEGLVITSNHVVNDRAGQPIVVRTAAGEQYQGQVIKVDTRNDLALIQLDAQETFPIVPLASVGAMQLGQAVCAIGSPYGRPGVLSEGTLSLMKRNGDLQASIRLYPGNSGGPLLNAQGEMIGVNKAILESPAGKNTGISFATNVQAVRNLVGSSWAVSTPTAGTVPMPPKTQPSIAPPETAGTEWAWSVPAVPVIPPTEIAPLPTNRPATNRPITGKRLGMTIDTRNLVVQRVQAGSAAARGGFRPGDRLLAVNGSRIGGFAALQTFLDRQPTTAKFTIARGRQQTTVQVRF